MFSFVHKLWVPILWWPIWNHHYCFCSVPSDLYYHLSYEAKMWENAKVGVMPNHQGQIDCHSIWFWMLWNISVYLFIYSWSKKIDPSVPNLSVICLKCSGLRSILWHHPKFWIVYLQLYYFFLVCERHISRIYFW